MSADIEAAELALVLPAGWYPMPDPAEPAAVVWPYELVGRLGFQGADAVSLLVSLGGALERAAAQERPRRLRWVLLGEPAVATVQAWARLDVVPRIEPDAATAADTWERGARAAGGDAVWHREVGRRTVHGDAAVVIHDLLAVGRPPAIQHRAVVTVFPTGPIVLSLSVSTPLLAALPDLEATALEIADGITIGAAA